MLEPEHEFVFPVASGGRSEATPATVGGKAHALIRLMAAGFAVPPGAVLTTGFFQPWFSEIMRSPAWTAFGKAEPASWPEHCARLQALATGLAWTAEQDRALDELNRVLLVESADDRFAVRSSAPGEDAVTASFAGLFQTRLGVPAAGLREAIRQCFVASLAARVFAYIKARGLDPGAPALALVVQRQIASEVAGVGFSLNPATNDYDEAVIDANWGLGVSVVDGSGMPDHFVLNKVDGAVIEAVLGDKRTSMWLDAAGGCVERRGYRAAERTLDDARLSELCATVARIETLYGCPVDVEWAYAGVTLHILQARPITAYVPLPEEMLTRPGERRRLYADAALSKGLTSNAPISPLGLDNMQYLFSALMAQWGMPMARSVAVEDALVFYAGCRMYVNYSNLLWLLDPRKLARGSAPTDAYMAAILAAVERKRYRATRRPPWVGIGLLWRGPRVLWRLRGLLWGVLRTVAAPERAHARYRQAVDGLLHDLAAPMDEAVALIDCRNIRGQRLASGMNDVLAVFSAGMISPRLLVRAATPERHAWLDSLERGAGGNVVVEMGTVLHHLSGLLDRQAFDDLPTLAEHLAQRRLPAPFLQAWDAFLARFGCRGPDEMDLASPRYADDPLLALRQMSFMAGDGGFDPRLALQRMADERRQAAAALLSECGPLRRPLLRRILRLNDLFAGSRDMPKHLNVLCNYALRRRALVEGRRLVGAGRLDTAEQVFGLTFEDLRAAAEDDAQDLRRVHGERTAFWQQLRVHVTVFPPVIDSRGRILRPPPSQPVAGELSGMPVSPGVATGPVKVLRHAGDKAVAAGDVLVAYTTDPGWTPLFVNAAAIVLEVGGSLQHGAIVARELGKPCVVGIGGVTARLEDGQHVEVDGGTGRVRLLDGAP